ncbi:leucine-rich repeat containing protein [Entamoeba histolytica HM-3:IMSS]|uniref:Leucinerich repeat-containing protein n=2 Tax=Entamoeba histolytica TaxID=5759 RepID=M2QK64_ENTHI|nr:leucinerich repeat-containing protein [Entamoeba histolytica KU27]EMS12943.1 leucine-rich repeat containing protein [Entamoeba histolytica HM-3:IMSS]
MAIVKKIDQHLKVIPEELCRTQSIYINVGELNFGNNEFEEIPETIQLFSSLKKISFASNKLREVNDYLFSLTGLEYICLNQNKIEEINNKITELTQLTSFEACANKLHEFNFNLNIQRLDLSANFFTTLNFSSTRLTFLDISQNDLTSFPNLNCPNLERINASFNNIELLPDDITILSSLKSCDLRNNKIKSLPKNFSILTSLTYLQLANNPINNVPPNFEVMRIRKLNVNGTQNLIFNPITTLKELNYSKVGVDVLFDNYSILKNLETLDVSNNLFKTLTLTSEKMISCNCSNNKLTTLIIEKGCSIQKLLARNNEISFIDSSIYFNSKLCVLDLSNNKITSLPNKPDMSRLNYLSIGFNKLSSFDMDLNKFSSLTFLDISFNKLNVIPSQIGGLTQLKTLYITGNNISLLPNEFSNLISLTTLHCSENKFTLFPNVLLNLSHLSKLYISSNYFESIPLLSSLINLQTLDISNCFLTSCTSIINLSHLEQLNLSNNYLSIPHNFNGCTSLIYLDLSYNSLQSFIDVNDFKNLALLDLSFNDLIKLPNHNPSTTVLINGCIRLQKFPFLSRFYHNLKFRSIPTTCATAQMCADRDEMQDSLICIPHFAAPEHYLFAGIDGHSGKYVSYKFSIRFPEIFYEMLSRDSGALNIIDALYQSFDTIQNEFANDPNVTDGAVATVIFMTPTKIYTAQCGDCRAVYITSSGVVQLAPEHKTSDRIEQMRVRSQGGFVSENLRVCGLLVARSVGDVKNKPIITHVPDITCFDRRDDEEYLVVATDGVWDEISNLKIHDILHSNRRVYRTSELSGLVKDIACVSCISGQHPDNIGIVLCRF